MNPQRKRTKVYRRRLVPHHPYIILSRWRWRCWYVVRAAAYSYSMRLSLAVSFRLSISVAVLCVIPICTRCRRVRQFDATVFVLLCYTQPTDQPTNQPACYCLCSRRLRFLFILAHTHRISFIDFIWRTACTRATNIHTTILDSTRTYSKRQISVCVPYCCCCSLLVA